MWLWLKGKKTYGVAAVMAIYALSGWGLGHLTQDQAIQILLNAAGIAGLRHGIGS